MSSDQPHTEIESDRPNARTGVAGLDDILRGGLAPGRSYLIEGASGTGKTTLALQFLLEGVNAGERGLYLTLSEAKEELEHTACAHGWNLDTIEIQEIPTSTENRPAEETYTMFHPAEVELYATISQVVEAIRHGKPRRVVLDSLTEIRLLAQTPLRYRRELYALRQFLADADCTTLLLDEGTAENIARSVVHGVIELEQLAPTYGGERRRLRVIKLRGVQFSAGYHDFLIRPGGLEVFPRSGIPEPGTDFSPHTVSSGVPSLDALTGGGLAAGSSTLLIGPAGSGKSSVATQYAIAAARRGERAAIFSFDESAVVYKARAASAGMDLEGPLQTGLIVFQHIDPAEMCPGEFAHAIHRIVEGQPISVLVIDSLNGYLAFLPDERCLLSRLHELLGWLGQQGVLSLLTIGQAGNAPAMETPASTSYPVDNVLVFRIFEVAGELRRLISVIKKRSGAHEPTIREIRLGPSGIQLGEPLREFQGVMSGIPACSAFKGVFPERKELAT